MHACFCPYLFIQLYTKKVRTCSITLPGHLCSMYPTLIANLFTFCYLSRENPYFPSTHCPFMIPISIKWKLRIFLKLYEVQQLSKIIKEKYKRREKSYHILNKPLTVIETHSLFQTTLTFHHIVLTVNTLSHLLPHSSLTTILWGRYCRDH